MVSVNALFSVLMPEQWSTFPVTDVSGDVWRYPDQSTCSGEQGDYHPEIDIKNVTLVGDDIVIGFKSTPIVNNASYQPAINIDNNNDGTTDYYIMMWTDGSLLLRRSNDSYIWNPVSLIWEYSLAYMNITVAGTEATIHDVGVPLPTLASTKIIVVWSYTGEAGYTYMDYAGDDPDCTSIPGFSWLPVFFSLLTLIALITYMRKEKFSL